MIVRSLAGARPFTTKDGSTIRSLLDRSNAPVMNQSLAEATLPPSGATEPHYHQDSEEFYYVVQGEGRMRIGEEERAVTVGDAILIPPGAVHTLRNTGTGELKILCCCAPPYAHEDTYFP
ncbi:MAG TPA: cupin domain-containing protein [Candidatus Sumerlaeota bacterium]|nr:cupin domain-containing protein [Candidatus Sumerlaeota bacterium]HOR28982.1 cupin domain-containing protein [Candidatus Sumerlaeota bacterium]